MKNKRRKFLRNAGSTALFASLGSSFFLSCDDTEDVINPDDNNENNCIRFDRELVTFVMNKIKLFVFCKF